MAPEPSRESDPGVEFNKYQPGPGAGSDGGSVPQARARHLEPDSKLPGPGHLGLAPVTVDFKLK